ncbi:MAG: DUF1631 domain-containing protein [Pseudomonadales bacterium]|nr:DUF1631 domain-containing protein [Pseudomonadales bacterium]
MNQEQDLLNGKKSAPTVTRALPGILRQVKDNSLSILANQMNEFFNSCDDLFFELANHAGSNNEQNLYFDSMREIRLKKSDVVNTFKDNFSAGFGELLRSNISKVDQHGDSFDSLGLVEDEKMEQDVAISSIISKTRQDCQENLYHLSIRFDYLLTDIKVDENNNPLDPKQICECFTLAVSVLQLDIKAKIILFKQFDRMVARHLNKIYSLANELLINAGVLPKVVPTVQKHKTADQPQSAMQPPAQTSLSEEQERAALNAGIAPQHGNSGPAPAQYSFEQLSSLLQGLRNAPAPAPSSASPGQQQPAQNPNIPQTIYTGSPDFGAKISQDTLIDQLTSLQYQLRGINEPQTQKQFQTAIYQILQSTGEDGKPSSLEQSDEDVINLVSMFFEFILDDRNLPVPIQALISRLQIPVLKIALKDKNFFNNANHVARVLINEIASLSIGWNDSNKEHQDTVFDLINNIIHTINDEFEGDCGIFESQLVKLRDFKESESKRAEIVETRTNQAAEGKAKADHAKETVQSLLLQRLGQQELPHFVSDFLINHWQKLLVLVRLKSGDSSPEWLANLQVVDDLIWVVREHHDEKSLKRASRIKPKLFESIEQGLHLTSLTHDQQQNILESLKGSLEKFETGEIERSQCKSLDTPQLAALGKTPENLSDKSWKDMTALERQQVKQQTLQYEFIKKAESLGVGTWFSFTNHDTGKTVRYKLANYIKPNERYVFVNRFGQRVTEKTKQEVASELQRNILKPLDSGPLFDRAMSKLADNLRRHNPQEEQANG